MASSDQPSTPLLPIVQCEADTHSIIDRSQGEVQNGSTWDIHCGYRQVCNDGIVMFLC